MKSKVWHFKLSGWILTLTWITANLFCLLFFFECVHDNLWFPLIPLPCPSPIVSISLFKKQVRDWVSICPTSVTFKNAYRDRKAKPGEETMKVPQTFTFLPREGGLRKSWTILQNQFHVKFTFCLGSYIWFGQVILGYMLIFCWVYVSQVVWFVYTPGRYG